LKSNISPSSSPECWCGMAGWVIWVQTLLMRRLGRFAELRL